MSREYLEKMLRIIAQDWLEREAAPRRQQFQYDWIGGFLHDFIEQERNKR